MNEEEPITADEVIDTLNYFRKNGITEVVIYLRKRKAHNGTLLNECRSIFNQFELLSPSKTL